MQGKSTTHLCSCQLLQQLRPAPQSCWVDIGQLTGFEQVPHGIGMLGNVHVSPSFFPSTEGSEGLSLSLLGRLRLPEFE